MQKRVKEIKRKFLEHPESVGETYFQHLRFALGVSFRAAFAAAACFVHAFFPFICVDTASKELEKINEHLKNRRCEDG